MCGQITVYRKFFCFVFFCWLQQKETLCTVPEREGIPRSSAWCVSGAMKGISENKSQTTTWQYVGALKLLLLCIKRSKLGWFDVWCLLSREDFLTRPTCIWYIISLQRLYIISGFGIYQKELECVNYERNVWVFILNLLPPSPDFG